SFCGMCRNVLTRYPTSPYSRTMTSTQARYRPKRVYEILSAAEGSRQIRLSDRIVELGEREYRRYEKVACWLSTTRGVADLSRELEMDEAKVPKLIDALEQSGLLYRVDDAPKTMTGLEFHARFSAVLDSWLSEAFAHPFWERMMSGRGSARLFTGWLIELYHYTKNANRHMPLSCAHAHDKPIKQHLDLDVQYQHSDLFKDILEHVPEIPPQRASTILDYGHQLVEHVWQWTENIEKYYQVESNPVPRPPFDFARD